MTKEEKDKRKNEIFDFMLEAGISEFDNFFMRLLKSNPETSERGKRLEILSQFCADNLQPLENEDIYFCIEQEILDLLAEHYTAEELRKMYDTQY